MFVGTKISRVKRKWDSWQICIIRDGFKGLLCKQKSGWGVWNKKVISNGARKFSLETWFRKFYWTDTRHISTIIIMRTGHDCYPEHLFKITENRNCECGGGLTHIFFECTLFYIENFNLYSELQKSVLFIGPINIFGILSHISCKIIQNLIYFLDYHKINI